MRWYERIKTHIQREWLLFSILALAFLLRIVGIGYGLPLAVVNDDAPFTLGALLMIKLQTILPALHPEFESVLYYPPYFSYLLLVPFTILLGIQYLLWHGDPALFQYHLIQDLSPFFMTARLVNVILGTLSVYFVYRIAHTFFRSKIAAAAAAFLLATSLLHIALSMTSRQWLPVAFFLVTTLFILTRGWSMKRRYLGAFITAGIGMGFSSIIALSCVLIGMYYLLFDARRWRSMLRDLPLFIFGSVVFLMLSAAAWLLYHGGNNFTGTITFLDSSKSILGLFASPLQVISMIVFSEPVLVVLSAGGLMYCVFFAKRVGILIAGFFAIYTAIFYIFFYIESRFVVPLIPFLSILGGYAIARLWNRRSTVFLCILLIIPGVVAIRLSYLALQGDTREHAREWVTLNLESSDRVLVFSSALHVPTQKAAVEELRSIDPGALRQIDEADAAINNAEAPHVLNNLTSISNQDFSAELPQYAKQHGYAYLVLEPRSLVGAPAMARGLMSLTADASIVARFDGFETPMSVWASSFTEPFTSLFQPKLLGPDIVIYRLRE